MRGSRCEVEASPASPGQFPGKPPSRPTEPPPGPQGFDSLRDSAISGWAAASVAGGAARLRYPCRMPGPRHVANELSESARFRDPRIWAGLRRASLEAVR